MCAKQYNSTGTSKGLWEIEDEKPPLRLSLLPITVIAVSDQYLAVSEKEGGLTIYQGGPSCWMKNSCSFQDQQLQRSISCCTSLLLHQQQCDQKRLFDTLLVSVLNKIYFLFPQF